MEHSEQQHQRSGARLFWGALIAVLILNIVIYFPSIKHIPRSDQLAYLAEVSQLSRFKELAFDSYDLSRSREIIKGDYLLFRPVVYFVLGSEKYFFGYHFEYWQMFGIFLHCLVIVMLFKIGFLIRPGPLTAIIIGYITTLPVMMEMVIWHHINSYLVFVIMMLIVLYSLSLDIRRKGNNSVLFIIIFISLLIACLTFELGVIYCFLILLYALMHDQRSTGKTKSTIIYPAIIYLAISLYHYMTFLGLRTGLESYQSNKTLLIWMGKGFGHIFNAFFRWLSYGLFPFQFDIILKNRSTIESIAGSQWPTAFSILMIVSAVVLFGRTRKCKSILNFQLPGLILSMLFSFAIVIAFGRLVDRGLGYLKDSLYYAYIFWTLFGVFIISFAEKNRSAHSAAKVILKCILGAACLVLIVLNSIKVFSLNQDYAQQVAQTRRLLKIVRQYQQACGTKDSCHIALDQNLKANTPIEFFSLKSDSHESLTIIQALYPDIVDDESPVILKQLDQNDVAFQINEQK